LWGCLHQWHHIGNALNTVRLFGIRQSTENGAHALYTQIKAFGQSKGGLTSAESPKDFEIALMFINWHRQRQFNIQALQEFMRTGVRVAQRVGVLW